MVEISFIIPTLNEEKRLPILLNSIKNQQFKDYEIIVADSNSRDNTLNIARKYKCKIVKGGHPSKGRNNGAKVAKGSLLVFMDADAILERGVLKKLLDEFKERKLDCGSVLVKPSDGSWIDKILHWIWNIWSYLNQWVHPYATGAFIICKRGVFRKLKGFDEKVKVCEDHDFVKRARLMGYRYRLLLSSIIAVSARRWVKEGRFRMLLKILQIGVYRIFIGELHKDYFGYNVENRKKFSDLKDTP